MAECRQRLRFFRAGFAMPCRMPSVNQAEKKLRFSSWGFWRLRFFRLLSLVRKRLHVLDLP